MLSGRGVYREWRQADQFGDPGKLVRRELLSIDVPDAKSVDLVTRKVMYSGILHSFSSEARQREPSWEGFSED